jgi:hypothetical protein
VRGEVRKRCPGTDENTSVSNNEKKNQSHLLKGEHHSVYLKGGTPDILY